MFKRVYNVNADSKLSLLSEIFSKNVEVHFIGYLLLSTQFQYSTTCRFNFFFQICRVVFTPFCDRDNTVIYNQWHVKDLFCSIQILSVESGTTSHGIVSRFGVILLTISRLYRKRIKWIIYAVWFARKTVYLVCCCSRSYHIITQLQKISKSCYFFAYLHFWYIFTISIFSYRYYYGLSALLSSTLYMVYQSNIHAKQTKPHKLSLVKDEWLVYSCTKRSLYYVV